MAKMSICDTQVKLALSKSAVDFIDFLCSLSGSTREDWIREVIRSALRAALDDPIPEWDEDYLKERFSLEPFLAEDC